MEQRNFNINNKSRNRDSRIWSGLILLAAGFLLLASKMGAPIPEWIFTWPVLLILIGLLTAVKSRFLNPGSFIMILIGSVFLIDQSVPGIDFHNYLIPGLLIIIGVWIMLHPRRNCNDRRMRQRMFRNRQFRNPENAFTKQESAENLNPEEQVNDNGEYIDLHAVFGGVKRNVQSKNFKGGEITSFMGGAEINFLQADMQKPVILDVNNVFAGTKLIIPANWDLKNEISAVFGGVEDKRNFNNIIPDTDKIVYLRGSCVFGGIEISNF